MFCTNCGYENSNTAKYCAKCGTPLSAQAPREAIQAEGSSHAASHNRSNRTGFIVVSVLLIVIAMILVVPHILPQVSGNGGSLERRIIGEWYEQGDSSPTITFYRDGTCEHEGWSELEGQRASIMRYWSLEGNQLIISNGKRGWSGTVISIEDGCLTIEGLGFNWNLNLIDDTERIFQYWDSP